MVAKTFGGGAAATTLSAGINSGVTSIAVADASTWPATGPFNAVIDRGLAGEEKLLVASRSGNTLTITTRGYDGTTATAHSSGATIEHCGTAIDFQENNDHVNASTNVHGLSGGAAVVGTTSSQTLTNKTLTQPTIGDFTNANHTHASTAQGGALGGTVTSFTPAISASATGWAVGNGTILGRYFQIGKLTFLDIYWDFGSTSTSGSGGLAFDLPGGITADATVYPTAGGAVPFGFSGSIYGGSAEISPLVANFATSSSMQVRYVKSDATNAAITILTNTAGSPVASVNSNGFLHVNGWFIAA